ncbi:hypothetical protein NN6n1_42620 [Shinella zoogloeoides]
MTGKKATPSKHEKKEKQVRSLKPPVLENRPPLSVGLAIARTLARQAAREDHEKMWGEKHHRKRVLTPPSEEAEK